MFSLKCIVLCIGGIIVGSSASSAPFKIEPCSPKDSACIIKSAEKVLPYIIKGIPEYGIPVLEPLVMKDVNADVADLKLSFKSMHMVGTSKTKFVNIERDPAKNTLKVVLDVPLDVTGEYVMSGNMLLVPVEGKGTFSFISEAMRFIVDIRLKDVTGDDGKKHYKISGFDYNFDLIKKVYLKFNNLYNGDKSKAADMEKLLDESWKELVTTVGKPVIEEAAKRMVDPIGRLFYAFSSDEIEIA